jgi:hypothetical protein
VVVATELAPPRGLGEVLPLADVRAVGREGDALAALFRQSLDAFELL